jgi:serine/threonine protein kinase
MPSLLEMLSSLGAGGMGEVYEALDTKLGRRVALKLPPAAYSSDPERLGRFEREARILAALNHTNIAGLYGLEYSDGKHVLAMELVPGETLAERIERGPIPIEDALAIAHQIVEALEAAHAKAIVHRDSFPMVILCMRSAPICLPCRLMAGPFRCWKV